MRWLVGVLGIIAALSTLEGRASCAADRVKIARAMLLVQANRQLDRTGVRPPSMTVGGRQLPYFFLRMPQTEMATVILEALDEAPGLTENGIAALEIGFGNPALMEVLRLAIPSARMTGVDILSVPSVVHAAVPESRMIEGNVPFVDAVATQTVAQRGPYGLIYALDVWKAPQDFYYGAPFQVSTDRLAYLRWIYAQLKPGGLVVAMNDLNAPLLFTRQEVVDSGFEVLRWQEQRLLQPESDRLQYQELAGVAVGEFVLAVLRRAKPTS